MECLNYKICNTTTSKYWDSNFGVCIDCKVLFGGILENVENVECPICLETPKQSVKQPNCNHSTCIDCFKRCYFGYRIDEPIFPYSLTIKYKFYKLIQHYDLQMFEFIQVYPLIYTYIVEWDLWDRKECEKYIQEECLRICPICRQ
jgi:hypothetical protein